MAAGDVLKSGDSGREEAVIEVPTAASGTAKIKPVAILDPTTGLPASLGGGTQYTEDAAAAANPVGNALILVRRDTLTAAEVTTDGDNIAGKATSKGELYTKDSDAVSVLGATTGAAVVTDANGTIQQYLRGLIVKILVLIAQFPAALGSAAAAASFAVTASTEDVARQGIVTETAPASDTASSGQNGRLQRIAQRLTSLIALVPAALGSAAAASSFAVTASTEDVARQGIVTETSPATDTASSGQNGRLQRIAQRLSSLIGLLPTALGSAAQAGGLLVTQSTEEIARQGIVTETAPASDTASSGLNGRLQRIAQRLTTLLPVGSVAAASSLGVTMSTEDIARQGIITETAPASDTASSGQNGRLQRIAQRITSLIALIPASLGTKLASASLSVTQGAFAYETVAASSTNQAMGATGATGDYLSHVIIMPVTTAAGTVTILDNATTFFTFTTGTLADLRPIIIPIGCNSVSGAWKITTGANVTAVGVGTFT